MPKRKSYRRRKTVYLQVNTSLNAGALAAGDVIAADFPATVDRNFKAIYAKLLWSPKGFTSGEGPVEAGLALGDYSAGEIEECLEANANWDSGDLIAQEEAGRKVRRTVSMNIEAGTETPNDGKPIYQKLWWDIPDGETMALWIRNSTSSTLTTGGAVIIEGVIAGYYT